MEMSERILRDFETIAVVGASREPGKAAHSVPARMQAAGFKIVPINPHATELFGERVYRTLADVPFPVDVVLVFRPSAATPDVARQAVAIGAKALWLQQGIHSEESRRIAESAGLRYVEDACAAVVRAAHGIRKPAKAS
jgi:predicted CoA-binding protein